MIWVNNNQSNDVDDDHVYINLNSHNTARNSMDRKTNIYTKDYKLT